MKIERFPASLSHHSLYIKRHAKKYINIYITNFSYFLINKIPEEISRNTPVDIIGIHTVHIMYMKITFTKQERTFLQQVGQSIYANPFTGKRHLSDCRLTGLPERTDPAVVLQAAVDQVSIKVGHLKKTNRANLEACRPQEQKELAGLFLFYLFHKYLSDFDHHIRLQNTTIESLPLPGGKNLERELQQFGFSEKQVCLYIGLFFQMRRAFFFINTSLIGQSPCMEQMRAHLWNTLFTHDIGEYADHLVDKLEDFSTLLIGETGTGKGLAASAIGRSGFIPYNRTTHRFTTSFTRAFLAINLCQYPEQLIESELFGHARGAFTGAVSDHQGLFSRSSRYGAVFLDEIGEVSIQTQIKLLRILQERVFTPVGSHTSHRFKGRLIAATNQNPLDLIEQGKFRNDFYFRLCTDTITLPPLRKRIEQHPGELDLLAAHLVNKIAGKATEKLKKIVFEALRHRRNSNYDWPGNVRELEQVVRRILLHGTCHLKNRNGKADTLDNQLLNEQPTMAELNSHYCRILYQRHGTMQAVARITGLDRRTVKKYIDQEK